MQAPRACNSVIVEPKEKIADKSFLMVEYLNMKNPDYPEIDYVFASRSTIITRSAIETSFLHFLSIAIINE